MTLKIHEVTDADIAFGNCEDFLPPMAKIPEEFHIRGGAGHTSQNKLFNDWFFSGISGLKVVPRSGVDALKALRMIRCMMGSFNPKHEHKEAAVAFMLHEFFEKIEYLKAGAEAPTVIVTEQK